MTDVYHIRYPTRSWIENISKVHREFRDATNSTFKLKTHFPKYKGIRTPYLLYGVWVDVDGAVCLSDCCYCLHSNPKCEEGVCSICDKLCEICGGGGCIN